MATFTERTTVVGVFDDRRQAERAIDALNRAGFRDDQIGFAMRDGEAPGGHAPPGETEAEGGVGAATGALTGGLLGGLLGGVLGGAAYDHLRGGGGNTADAATPPADPGAGLGAAPPPADDVSSGGDFGGGSDFSSGGDFGGGGDASSGGDF